MALQSSARAKVKAKQAANSTSESSKGGGAFGSSNSLSANGGTDNAGAVDAVTTKLFDLCHGSYYKKHSRQSMKYKKRKRVDGDEINDNRLKVVEGALAVKQQKAGNISEAILAGDASRSVSSSTQFPSGPRVEIVNGKIVVQESSLLLNNVANVLEEDAEDIVEEGVHASATYNSYLKKRPSKAWGLEETRLFYHSLRQCGTDFTIMQAFFPMRTRRQLRSKFFREEKHHAELVKHALETCLPLELAPFEARFGESLVASGTAAAAAVDPSSLLAAAPYIPHETSRESVLVDV